MDLVNTGTDPWILEQQACEALNRDILELLNNRGSLDVSSKEYNALSGKIRSRLKQFTLEVDQLNKKLKLANDFSSITTEEYERRMRQVENLQSNIIKLQDDFNKRKGKNYSDTAISKERSQLLGPKKESSVIVDLGTTNWGDLDYNESGTSNPIQSTSYETIDDLRSDQKKLLEEQDENLDSLAKIISKNKQIASAINVEISQQNELLDDITTDLDGVQGRIQREANMVRIIGRKDKTWGYWVIIILLLVAIIGIAFA